jgi:ankyrin repeat protein
VLNKQSLNPFHVAIKAGNSKLVRFILERRGGKSFQDCHPSKATPSGSTPLQLAIESNDLVTVELLVKHATTHDVERCWKLMDISEDIKEVLRTKVCLVILWSKSLLIRYI